MGSTGHRPGRAWPGLAAVLFALLVLIAPPGPVARAEPDADAAAPGPRRAPEEGASSDARAYPPGRSASDDADSSPSALRATTRPAVSAGRQGTLTPMVFWGPEAALSLAERREGTPAAHRDERPDVPTTRPFASESPQAAPDAQDPKPAAPPPAPAPDPVEMEPIRRTGRQKAALGAAGDPAGPTGLSKTPGTTGLLWKSLSGLAIVCGLMLAGVLVLKRVVPGAQRGSNSAGLTVLGRAYVGPKASLFLVKVGRRVLVLGSTPAGIARVAEIADPEEVEQVLARCQRTRGNSVTNSFRHLLAQGVARHRHMERICEEDAEPEPEPGPPEVGEEDSTADETRPTATQEEREADAEADDDTDDLPASADLGLIRQELDLILEKVRSWHTQEGLEEDAAQA